MKLYFFTQLAILIIYFVSLSENSSTKEKDVPSLDQTQQGRKNAKTDKIRIKTSKKSGTVNSTKSSNTTVFLVKLATNGTNGTTDEIPDPPLDPLDDETTVDPNNANMTTTTEDIPYSTTTSPLAVVNNVTLQKPSVANSTQLITLATSISNSTIIKGRGMGVPKPPAGLHNDLKLHPGATTGHEDNFHSDDYHNITDGDLSAFSECVPHDCTKLCGETRLSKCCTETNKICLCAAFKFVPIEIEGKVSIANLQDEAEKTCSESCIVRFSYARIVKNKDGTKQCVCLTHQVSKTGITYCDGLAKVDVCKKICQSQSANCAFNGVCLCRRSWPKFENSTMPFIRTELPTDHGDCSKRCTLYHHDFVGRIYDTRIGQPAEDVNSTHHFQAKYCLCGPESNIHNFNQTKDIISEGFHICSGLKCKQRCGVRDAICEPNYRRACLCHRQNIFIGPHLWSRLPSHAEKFCQDACFAHGLHARVIEKNPLLVPAYERFRPWYRWSMFSHGYDGKFCHCIKIELDMNQFRPCTDELCHWICGHAGAECDKGTRRDCLCNTHRLIGNLGRTPDPGEINCHTSCRYQLMNAKVIDVTWDTDNMDGWGVKKSKFCGCIRATTPAGLTHCNGDNDECPSYCNNKEAYCTREMYCECGIDNRLLLNHGAVRIPTGPENEECYEKCRSWLWPIAEDLDHHAFIYDEGRELCSKTDSCPEVDSTPWDSNTIGFHVDRNIMNELEPLQPKKICLCSKTTTTHFSPGTRFLPKMMPHRALRGLECVGNHTCVAVGNAIHIK